MVANGKLRHVIMHSSLGKASRERKNDESVRAAQEQIRGFVTDFRALD
jgi:hypothetical protein